MTAHNFRRQTIANTLVSHFFSQITALLESAPDVSIDVTNVLAYYADPERRATHVRAASAHLVAYHNIVRDLLDTATSLRNPDSLVSQELLVDWVTTASDFALERLQVQA